VGRVTVGLIAGAECTSLSVGRVFSILLGGIVLVFISDRFNNVVNSGGEGILALVLTL
jgi:hypothetical protein